MILSSARNRLADTTHLPVAVLFIVLVAIAGGASRSDELLQVVVRVGAILCLTMAFVIGPSKIPAAARSPILLCGLLFGWMFLQLVPLPPALWTVLPGRTLVASLGGLIGEAQGWRPISLAPDLTINSVLAMLVPLCALAIFSSLNTVQLSFVLKVLLGVIGVSALFAIAQMTGRATALYFYRTTDEHGAVGLFANRNHQALLLALAAPLIVTLLSQIDRVRKRMDVRIWITISVALALLPLVLATGSRAGLVAFVAGLALSVPLHRRLRNSDRPKLSATDTRAIWVRIAAVVALIALVGGLALVTGRAATLTRLFSMNVSGEQRFQLVGPIMGMAVKYLPIGAGFGTFDRVFRVDEPFSNLGPQYLNHAHNDWLELVIEGGVPAVVLLALFLVWLGRAAIKSWRLDRSDRSSAHGRLGSVIILLIGIASFADYPLRTPLMSTIFVVACCLVASGADRPVGGRSANRHTT